MKKFLCIMLSIVLMAAIFTGCGNNKNTADNGKINVVASIFPEYDFARAIAGDNANLSMLIAPGASIHSFDPTPAQIRAAQNADIFIYIGGESDIWADNLLASLDTSNMKILRLMDFVENQEEELKEGMEPEEEEADDGEEAEEAEYDEHIWTSPKNAVLLIDAIADALCEKDGDNADLYKTNAAAYQAELQAVDEEIAAIVANAGRKKIVVADKFPFLYFVNQYGLDYAAAFSGCSDQTDASAQTMAYLINIVKNDQIPYVYYVELSNQSVADAISEQTGTGTLLLNSCHNVTKVEFDNGATYLSLMKQNAENLRKGLN
ncbi:periplasmic divalent manganese/zinc-binding lipoprotein [Clostridia bacterium]|nr:periplasmic divalent manganese/zinc-binding lipoprotein [Clostridia bacterium]